MQQRYQAFNPDRIEKLRTDEENRLHHFIGELAGLNDVLKYVDSSIDTINKEEAKSILHKLQNSVSDPEIQNMLLKAIYKIDSSFTGINNLLERKPNNIDINKQDP